MLAEGEDEFGLNAALSRGKALDDPVTLCPRADFRGIPAQTVAKIPVLINFRLEYFMVESCSFNLKF